MKTRLNLRVPLPLPVRFRTPEMAHSEMTRIRDISWGGVFLFWREPLEMGTRVILEFLVSGDSVAIEIWGTVARIETSPENKVVGMGIEFDQIDDETRSAIQKMVNTYLVPIFKKLIEKKK